MFIRFIKLMCSYSLALYIIVGTYLTEINLYLKPLICGYLWNEIYYILLSLKIKQIVLLHIFERHSWFSKIAAQKKQLPVTLIKISKIIVNKTRQQEFYLFFINSCGEI